jgi:tRNA (guanine37-N1)-methyltransferase
VLGDAASAEDESFARYLLEYPHFTRPQSFEERVIPDVLNNGNHLEISKWRRAQAESLTKARRPDLWSLYEKGSFPFEKKGG